MVAMSSSSRARLASLLNIAESAPDLRTKLGSLRRLHQVLLLKREDEKEDEEEEKGFSSFFSGLLPRFFALLSDKNPPVRKFVTEIIGEIGMKYSECVPDIVRVLMSILEDRTPAVARQAIKCGISLFRSTLERVAVQGLYASELDERLKSSWASVLDFKEKIYTLAFQQGSGGVRLLALKCVEAIILLYTPDPSGSPEPPSLQKGDSLDFNISWIRGRHPVLNAGDLSIEASKTLSLFLDQLRLPTIKSLSNLVIIVLINSLAKIAKKRPPYYGRILPVLLGLDPSKSVIQGTHAYGACLALKNAFLSCLKCPHPCAAPWRERLVGALREMKVGGTSEDILLQTSMRNGNVEQGEGDSLVDKEEKPLVKLDNVSSVLGRKRSVEDEYVSSIEDDNVSGKRVRSSTSGSDESTRELSNKASDFKDDSASDGCTTSKSVNDSGPVQQLVAMFGALVAQGEKAVGSLEILISSISADLLAEVVIASMRHLPTSSPQAVGNDESLENMTIIGSDTQAKYPPSFLANVLSLSSSFPSITSQLPVKKSISDEDAVPETEEQLHVMDDGGFLDNACSQVVENEVLATDLPALSTASVCNMDVDDQKITSDIPDVDNLESEIPGLDLSFHNVLDVAGTTSLISINLEDASGEQVTSLSSRSSLDLHPSMSAERSEELSPKAAVMEASSIISSTATSTHVQSDILLPKMSAPVVNLDDNQKVQLQTSAFVRIIEAYKHVATAGGSQVRFSLLAYLGVEFSSEIEPWELLQTHILSDYLNLEGHELTLCVLYRLFSEVEEDRDFFSSTTAASVYETFLLTVAKTLRDSFPPSDKSLNRLLGEAPYLPKSVLDILVALCSPGDGDKTEKESQSGDRLTQGLSTVWSLILQRPSLRESCLNIALQSAVHNLEEVRMKAIRLVANKLFPLPFCARQIEDFAMEKLLSVAQVDVMDSIDTKGSIAELPKVSDSEKRSNELQSASAISTDISSDTHQVRSSQSALSLKTSEAQRCTSLYFALCTKKHSLLHQIFVIYQSASKAVKQAINLHIPILVRTIGSSPGLLEIISDPPDGSEDLLMQVLQTLTEGSGPPPELLVTTRKLYGSKLKNAEILIPILPFLPRDEVLLIFPQLVNLPLDKFQVALSRVLQGSSLSGPVLTPSEVLIAIHGIDPNRDGIPLKKVTDACNCCFEQRQIFTQQVLAKVLNQLVEQIPLPLLFMRTVLQAIGAFPALVDFILEILSRLVNKQIWKYPKLWVGFLKCAALTKPQSFSVLLQLPPPQLENALHRTPDLKAPLVAHASQPNIKASLPRSVLATLGITADAQTSSQAPTIETSNSEKEVQTEISKESSNAS